MASRLMLVGTVAVLGAVSAQLLSDWRHVKATTTSRQPLAPPVNQQLNEQIARLQSRLSAMELRAAVQERSVLELASVKPAATPDPVVVDPKLVPTDQSMNARERWEADFGKEQRDNAWSRGAENKIMEVAAAFQGLSVQSLDCRSRTCRFTAEFADGKGDLHMLGNKLTQTIGEVRMHLSDNPGREVYYVVDTPASPSPAP